MKRIISAITMICLLSACGSEEKGGTSGPGGAPTTSPNNISTTGAGSNCPVFEGIYTRKVKVPQEDGTTEEVEQQIELHTKVENGISHYKLSAEGTFKAADGELKEMTQEGVEGKTRLSCDANSVVYFSEPSDADSTTIKYTLEGANKLKIETNGDLLLSMAGVYTKKL